MKPTKTMKAVYKRLQAVHRLYHPITGNPKAGHRAGLREWQALHILEEQGYVKREYIMPGVYIFVRTAIAPDWSE